MSKAASGIGIVIMVLGGLMLGVYIISLLMVLAGNAFKAALDRWVGIHAGLSMIHEYRKNREKFLKWNESPPAETMAVVRCKNCKYHREGLKMPHSWCSKWENITRNDDFCSFGERRNDD